MPNETNPLLESHGLPKFDQIKAEHVVPAMEQILKESEDEIKKIESLSNPNWQSVFEPMEKMEHRFGMAWGPINHLVAVRTSQELRKAHEEVQPKVVSFSLRVSQSAALFKIYKTLQQSPEAKNYTPAQKRILEAKIKSAELSGIGLEGALKEEFNEISKELSNLSTNFSNNVLDATKQFEMILKEPAEVAGLPADILAMASQSYNESRESEPKGSAQAGPWRITLDHPSYTPFMQHAKNRALREKLYLAHIQKASSGDFDNTGNMNKILKLRQRKANILGYESFAEVSLEKKMATSVAEVDTLLQNLREKSWEPGKLELEELANLAKSEGQTEDLANWDVTYWAERLREKKFEVKDEELKPYFPLPNILEGMFHLCKNLFGIEVKAADGETSVWHPDVRFFKVYDLKSKDHIASFFLDPYTRPADKRGGAWMNECVGRALVGGKIRIPVAYLVCNSSAPVDGKPCLLSFREVETLFHEFGHGLQHMLTTIDFADASGINGIEWDAVELPSQFMENWCYHKPTLLGMAKHYETGEALPDALFEKLSAARTHMAATMMLRQLRFGLTDLELHHRYDVEGSESVFEVADRIGKTTSILPSHPNDRMLCSFAHIFAGGYAAGYFSYKWAEVLSADAFSAFEDAGLDSDAAIQETGKRFRDTVLSLGGSQHPMEVFRAFRGREPSPDALLRHSGLSG